jgi:hypothetical protein
MMRHESASPGDAVNDAVGAVAAVLRDVLGGLFVKQRFVLHRRETEGDVVDTSHPVLARMREKRQRGYPAMGYRIGANPTNFAIKSEVELHFSDK